MAQTIPCDICTETAALFLVTFTPTADVLGLGVECVGVWAEGLAAQAQEMGVDPADTPEGVIRIIVVPTGDELVVNMAGALEWAEEIVRALEAAEAAQAAGPDVEPIDRPERPRRARKGRSGPVGPTAAADDVSDAEWEASGEAGRPPLPAEPTGADGPGEGVEADAPQAAGQ